MTKQDVIEELRCCVIENCNDCDGISEIGCDKKCDSLQALDFAIECIEKQMPLKGKTRFVGNGWNDIWEGECPKCGKTISPSKFCFNCGQAIDWESDNE